MVVHVGGKMYGSFVVESSEAAGAFCEVGSHLSAPAGVALQRLASYQLVTFAPSP
jgi:hypothetical protein